MFPLTHPIAASVRLHVHTYTQWRGGGPRRHVSTYKKISFPHMPGPQPASCSLKKKKKGLFLLCAHSDFIEDFRARSRPSCHMYWPSSPLGLFINQQARDGSSGIILTVGPARIGLDAASRTDTRTSLSQEGVFIMLLLLQNHQVRYDGMQTIYTFLFPFFLAALDFGAKTCEEAALLQRGLHFRADQSQPVLFCERTQAPCQRSKGTTRAPIPASGTRRVFSAENAGDQQAVHRSTARRQ